MCMRCMCGEYDDTVSAYVCGETFLLRGGRGGGGGGVEIRLAERPLAISKQL